MSMFEYFRKKVGETAQSAAKKSGELLEIAKLNMSISSEEDKIKELYAQIGKKVYTSFTSTAEAADDFREACEQIRTYEQSILDLKQKILDIKRAKICFSCGSEQDQNAVFCSKCGAKLIVE